MKRDWEKPTSLSSPPLRRDDLVDFKKLQIKTVHHHAELQLDKLKEHANLLIKQAEEIFERVELAEKVLTAKFNFKPVFNKLYYLYEKKNIFTLSLIAPEEWKGKSPHGNHVAVVKQLGDGTWEEVKS